MVAVRSRFKNLLFTEVGVKYWFIRIRQEPREHVDQPNGNLGVVRARLSKPIGE
jgi:hypothetical protein